MSRYIDADAFVEWLKMTRKMLTNDGERALITGTKVSELVANFPTVDAVEVVRCKDCRFSKDTGDYQDSYRCSHPTHNQNHLVHSGDFCSYGMKMDEVEK